MKYRIFCNRNSSIILTFCIFQAEIGVKRGWVVNLEGLKETRCLFIQIFCLLDISIILLNSFISH